MKNQSFSSFYLYNIGLVYVQDWNTYKKKIMNEAILNCSSLLKLFSFIKE